MDMIASIRDAFVRPARQALVLHENQIIQGKITKIYPNNKAQIQIGTQQFIAEISTSLSIGKQYFFQVQGTEQHIHLKVLGESMKQNASMTIQALMEQLGLKVTRANIVFMEMMVQQKIPFSQQQIEQALPLLSSISDKQTAFPIIKMMIQQKLPITNAVYQALLSNQSQTVSALLHDVMATIQNRSTPPNVAEQNLLNMINHLVKLPVVTQHDVTTQLYMQLKEDVSFLNAMKALGIVTLSETANNWRQQVNHVLSNQHTTAQQAITLLLADGAMLQQPQQLEIALKQLVQQQNIIQQTALKMTSIIYGLQQGSLPNEAFSTLTQMIEQELLPLLPEQTAHAIRQLIGQSTQSNQQALYQMLGLLGNQGTYQEMAAILSAEVNQQDKAFVQQTIQQQFLSHVNTFLKTIGIADEHILKSELMNQLSANEFLQLNQTIKSQLLQMMQQESGVVADKMQSLLHFINGMQLQSVVEVNNLLQAAMYLPGGKLGLHEDIYMQFEGQKTKEGQIDPDYCRILFVLHLENLEETMVDLHIQKRIVSVSIFNEQASPELGAWTPLLQQGLEKLNYTLSTVNWKPLYKEEAQIENNERIHEENRFREGYDFLI